MSEATSQNRQQPGDVIVAELDIFLVNEQGRLPKIDPKELKPGQHVQLLTGENLSADLFEDVMLTRSFAGTVKANDGERLVLSDVVMIDEARSQTGVPVVSKVPYMSRLFKNTSEARQGISIPGEVALERSKILFASELTEDRFQTMRQNGGHARVGLDFDFNDPEGNAATTQQ